MQDLSILREDQSNLKIICFGAHSDDLEIGCGGTILKLLSSKKSIQIYWIVLSSDEIRKKEAFQSATRFLNSARERKIVIKEYRDGFFPYIGYEIKDYFESLKKELSPDLIFTHYREDRHQDHRIVNELTWNTYRDHLILEYEIPKYDGDLGSPNSFVHLSKDIFEKKVEIILDSFKSQGSKEWFNEKTFNSIAHIRGIESNAPDQIAEGFYSRKLILT